MPHPRFRGEEIDRRGQELYDQRIRAEVETNENIGKIIVIYIETGEYEIDNDAIQGNVAKWTRTWHIETGEYEIDNDAMIATDRALEKHPEAALLGLRIGYNAVEGFGGGPERVKQ